MDNHPNRFALTDVLVISSIVAAFAVLVVSVISSNNENARLKHSHQQQIDRLEAEMRGLERGVGISR